MKILRAEPRSNPKIVNHIYEIKEYHRNPIMHPEETLDATQAEALMGVCRTLIQSIANELPDGLTSESE